jgi:hypothetical protein
VSERGAVSRLFARLTGTLQLERIAAVEEKVAKFGRAHREELAAQRSQLEQVRDSVATRAGADVVKTLDRRLEALQAALAQQDRTLADALERAGRFDEQAVDDRRFARRVEQMLRHDRPVIVGPWTGEVGFELLYWVPFVRRTVARYNIDPSRLVVVSRGGTASWYGPLAARYIDIFSLATPDAFRVATEDAKKQRRVGEFDAHIVARVRESPGLKDAELLHPGMMYRLFNPFWKELATVARVDAYTEYGRLAPPATGAVAGLPDDYVAARFYFSDCFPDTPANRTFVASTLETLSRQTSVVLLDTPFAVDDHRDVPQAGTGLDLSTVSRTSERKGGSPGGARNSSAGVVAVTDRMTPQTNLAVQTAVIARARAFVGTYGGYSYLAPFHGVPAIAFYSERTFKAHHLHLAQRVFERLGGADVVAIDVAHASLLNLALTGAAVPVRT